jgi:hypothetical protein
MQVVSYHTHIPHYIPQYTWDGLVEPMWKVIRFCTLMADLTLVPSNMMKVPTPPPPPHTHTPQRHTYGTCQHSKH